jgi:hypothetical protein
LRTVRVRVRVRVRVMFRVRVMVRVRVGVRVRVRVYPVLEVQQGVEYGEEPGRVPDDGHL